VTPGSRFTILVVPIIIEDSGGYGPDRSFSKRRMEAEIRKTRGNWRTDAGHTWCWEACSLRWWPGESHGRFASSRTGRSRSPVAS